ncbi:NF-kappa-B inhibitor delta [Protopterus annectens]|uniref:NF-kappa-B inhibitor delta n=1 Tax=Protopterus annectens TaxID=7888 RepID=UPI001CFAADDF|nr:NF-kappa-B inhibitor delta [Protopterus annectens]
MTSTASPYTVPQAFENHWPQMVMNPSCNSLQDPGGFIQVSAVSPREMEPGKLDTARQKIRSLNISQILHEDEDGDTLLHIYAAKGMREFAYAVAELLQEYNQLDIKEHRGKTPLLVAITANQPDIVKDLILLGADVNISDQNGQTALHLAATYGLSSIIEGINSTGAALNIEARNFEGLTPLHCAVISHNSTFKKQLSMQQQVMAHEKMICIQLLLHMGANIFSQEIKSNKTVLHLAVQEGNLPLVKFFLELEFQDKQKFVNLKAHGNTALHMAAGLHNDDNQEQIIRLLLAHGADVSIRNLENDQAVHLLQPGEKGERIKHLLKRGRAMTSSRHQNISL